MSLNSESQATSAPSQSKNCLYQFAREVKAIIDSYKKLALLLLCAIIAAVILLLSFHAVESDKSQEKCSEVNEKLNEVPKVRFDVFYGDFVKGNSSKNVPEELKDFGKFCFSFAKTESNILCVMSENVKHSKIDEICGKNLAMKAMKVDKENFEDVNEFLRKTFGFGRGSILWISGKLKNC